MFDTLKARFADALEIWEPDQGQFPQGSPVGGFIGFLLRAKCSVCILFDWKGDGYDYVPVWIGPMFVYGHDASWSEVGVKWGWRNWQYLRYRNGI